jgi:hypothetical protein
MKYIFRMFLVLTILLPISSVADSLDTLVSDLGKRVTFVVSSANCIIKNTDSYSCQTVIAKCPTGKKLAPPLSNCTATVKNGWGYFSVDKNANDNPAQLECNINYVDYIESFPATVTIKSTAACTKYTDAQVSTVKNFLDKVRH